MLRPTPSTFFAAIVLMGLGLSHISTADESTLELHAGDELIVEFQSADLAAIPGFKDYRLYDAMHKKHKHFAGVPLIALLKRAYGESFFEQEWSSIAFIAQDGYEAVAPFSVLSEQGAILVFDDLNVDGWETIDGKGVIPGPFYLVWTEPQQLPKNGYPWPWQINSIRLLNFDDTYPAIVPSGVSSNSAADRGYQLFRTRCMSCHSMNRQGGDIGPDLNAPRNITDYRTTAFLKEFIRSPARFRYSKMPEFADLSDENLDELVRYLQFMKAN